MSAYFKPGRNGNPSFLYGREGFAEAAACAETCGCFLPDDEDEQMADEPISCYNCKRRRWTREGFECLGGDSAQEENSSQ